jgi:uncharacterized protein YjbI with pentapeptide repeats
MVSALASSVITGNSLNLDPEQMLKTALSARASQYAMNSLSIQTKYDATKDFNTNLVGAKLNQAQLQGADLYKAQLQGAYIGHLFEVLPFKKRSTNKLIKKPKMKG